MTESYQLIDDAELSLYLVVYEELMRQYKRIQSDPSLVLSDAFWTEMFVIASANIVPELTKSSLNGAALSLAEVTEELPDNLFENVRLAAQQRGGELIRGINDTTRQRVIELLDRSILENWTEQELTDALLNLPGSPFGEVRARLISITETTNAYMGGAEIAAEELRNAGYIAELIWNTVRDDLVCPICEPRDGRAQGDGWTNTGAAHPGCRCFTVTRVRKLVPE